MTDPMDFPANPYEGQTYTNSIGVVYVWDGQSWIVVKLPTPVAFTDMKSIVDQVRTILQDTVEDYRYSTASIVANLNQGMLEMYRLRPDIFLETAFRVPVFYVDHLEYPWPVEPQWIPPIVYYTVGLTQVRDDEGTQDTRAAAFLSRFVAMIEGVTA